MRVYEKLFAGIWSEKGFFNLIDYKYEKDNNRLVFKYVLEETEVDEVDIELNQFNENTLKPRTRVIPSEIKRLVWERDRSQCVLCGSTDELHFDHELPYSKGGTSVKADNVRILCARYNLEKSAKIE